MNNDRAKDANEYCKELLGNDRVDFWTTDNGVATAVGIAARVDIRTSELSKECVRIKLMNGFRELQEFAQEKIDKLKNEA